MSLKILESIADIIESRPVLGHWPHMRAKADADYLRSVAKDREQVTAELTAFNTKFQTTIDVLSGSESYVAGLEKRIADGLKLFEDFYLPPPEGEPEEAQRILAIVAALRGKT